MNPLYVSFATGGAFLLAAGLSLLLMLWRPKLRLCYTIGCEAVKESVLKIDDLGFFSLFCLTVIVLSLGGLIWYDPAIPIPAQVLAKLGMDVGGLESAWQIGWSFLSVLLLGPTIFALIVSNKARVGIGRSFNAAARPN